MVACLLRARWWRNRWLLICHVRGSGPQSRGQHGGMPYGVAVLHIELAGAVLMQDLNEPPAVVERAEEDALANGRCVSPRLYWQRHDARDGHVFLQAGAIIGLEARILDAHGSIGG